MLHLPKISFHESCFLVLPVKLFKLVKMNPVAKGNMKILNMNSL